MRFLALVLFAGLLVPSAHAVVPGAAVCGLAVAPPPAGTFACAHGTLTTPAGVTYANATAEGECGGTGPTSQYHANVSVDLYAPLGNPGLAYSDQGNYAKLPYLCEL